MRSKLRQLLLIVVVSVTAGICSFAWAEHGHSFGHGYGGGWSHAGHAHFDGHGGFYGHRGIGGFHFYSGHYYGWPYRYSAWPYTYRYFGYPYVYGYYGYPYSYGYYGYPSTYYDVYPPAYYGYPLGYDANENFDADAQPPQEYSVSRPESDIARLEVRLPDPEATIWVEGKEIVSKGTMRQFNSPQLDPAQQYTYTIKAEWHNNGQLLTDERKVNVRANSLSVVDFNQPSQASAGTHRPTLPELPPPQRAAD